MKTNTLQESVFKLAAQLQGKKSEVQTSNCHIWRCSFLQVRFQMKIRASHDSWNRVTDKYCVKVEVFWLESLLFSIWLQITGSTLRMLRCLLLQIIFVRTLCRKRRVDQIPEKLRENLDSVLFAFKCGGNDRASTVALVCKDTLISRNFPRQKSWS